MKNSKPHKTILIGEDDVDIAELLEILLKAEGFQTITCLDGKAAEEKLLKFLPDLIIMDLHLPKLDGASLIKKLKGEERTSAIPVIIVSAQNRLMDIAKRVKADGFLPKPFDIKDVLSAVRKFI